MSDTPNEEQDGQNGSEVPPVTLEVQDITIPVGTAISPKE